MSNFAGGRTQDNSVSGDGAPGVGQTGYLASGRSTSKSYSVSLDVYPVINDSAASAAATTAAFRVFYDPDADPYTPYVMLRCFVVDFGDRRMFVGVFDTDTGDVVPVIQLPLVGQTLESLVVHLQSIPGISAQILNNWGFVSTDYLLETGHLNATSVWAYFFVQPETVRNSRESTLPADLRFYYTSVLPIIEQNNPSQSVGGFASPSELYDSSKLTFSVSFYDQAIRVEDTNLTSYTLLQINDEIVEIDRWEEATAYVKSRQAFFTPIRFHPEGSIVRGISKNDVFDIKMNKEGKQYRCIALRNASETETAHDVRLYFKLASRNSLSRTRVAIEIPRSDYVATVAKPGTKSVFKGIGLEGTYQDGHFVGAALTFTSGDNDGQTRLITGYTGNTGEIVLEADLPFSVSQNDDFHIDPSPSQRVRSGFESPIVGTAALEADRIISEFNNAIFYNGGVSIDVGESRRSGIDLKPQETIYIWIEREIDDINQGFVNNRSILTATYSRV